MAETRGGEETIVITPRDLHQDVCTCLDPDRNLWVTFGFPTFPTMRVDGSIDTRKLYGPPYIFKADTLTLTDEGHPEGFETKDVTVILMHGGRKMGGHWQFSSLSDGFPVVDTVLAANHFLSAKGEDPISVILSCNPDPSENDDIRI